MTPQAPIDAASGQEATWCHLVPAGITVRRMRDGRPYSYKLDAAAIARLAASFDPADPLLVDREHYSLDPAKGDSTAMGWIESVETRADGIWSLIRWTPSGAALVANRELRMLSPVFDMDNGAPSRLAGAALTNTPFFRKQLTPVANKDGAGTQEKAKEKAMEKIIALLGLPPDADEAAVEAAVNALIQAAKDAHAAAAEAEAAKAWQDHKALFRDEAQFKALYKQDPALIKAFIANAAPAIKARAAEPLKAQPPSFRITDAGDGLTREAFKAQLAKQPVGKRQEWHDANIGKIIE